MNYNNTDIRALVYADSETPNLDFKETIIWDSTHNGERYEIIKDILAMANTRDGGKIIIGINNKTRDLVGLSDEAFASLEITKLNELLHKYADPVFTCNVVRIADFAGKKPAALQSGVLFWDNYISAEDAIIVEKNLSSVELQASANTIALDLSKEIFMH